MTSGGRSSTTTGTGRSSSQRKPSRSKRTRSRVARPSRRRRDSDWSTDRFVPPTPPPLPTPTTDRLIAWLGVFGSPVVLLVCLVFGIDLPQLVAYLLVAGFVGGFLYLVIQMPRGPRDPDDDGAQL
jgi:hypothetical protein